MKDGGVLIACIIITASPPPASLFCALFSETRVPEHAQQTRCRNLRRVTPKVVAADGETLSSRRARLILLRGKVVPREKHQMRFSYTRIESKLLKKMRPAEYHGCQKLSKNGSCLGVFRP